MFYAIHRTIKFLMFCCVAAICWKAYQHRYVLEPALIWYDVWDNGGFRDQESMQSIQGSVEQVMNSQTFILKTTNKPPRLNVRLLGLREPSKNLSVDVMEKEKMRKEALEDLIKGKDVRLDLAYENFNNVGGIVFLGATNVNAYLVQQKLAFTDKELVRGFPKDIQYQMLWSKRHRITNDAARPN